MSEVKETVNKQLMVSCEEVVEASLSRICSNQAERKQGEKILESLVQSLRKDRAGEDHGAKIIAAAVKTSFAASFPQQTEMKWAVITELATFVSQTMDKLSYESVEDFACLSRLRRRGFAYKMVRRCLPYEEGVRVGKWENTNLWLLIFRIILPVLFVWVLGGVMDGLFDYDDRGVMNVGKVESCGMVCGGILVLYAIISTCVRRCRRKILARGKPAEARGEKTAIPD